MKFKTIIFDVDGTLLNGEEGIISSVRSVIEHFGLRTLPHEDLLSFVGPPVQDSFIRLYNTDEKTAQEYANFFRKCYVSGDVFKAVVYDGVYELLEYLKSCNYNLGVATYKRQDYAFDLMQYFNFDKYFTSICGADNENKLEKSDILQNCMLELNAVKSETILIGDSIHDALGAEKAGVEFIGVTYGYGFKSFDEIKKYKPVFCAKNAYDIISFFKQ